MSASHKLGARPMRSPEEAAPAAQCRDRDLLWRQLSEPVKVRVRSLEEAADGLQKSATEPAKVRTTIFLQPRSCAPEFDDEDDVSTAASKSRASTPPLPPAPFAKKPAPGLEALGLLPPAYEEERLVRPPAPGSNGYFLVTIRRLPRGCGKEALVEELHDAGFVKDRDFNFLCIPTHPGSGLSLGYGFISLMGTATARAFLAAFHGRELRNYAAGTAVEVAPSTKSEVEEARGMQLNQGRAIVHLARARQEPRLNMQFCPQCGTRIQETQSAFNFCAHCGTALKATVR